MVSFERVLLRILFLSMLPICFIRGGDNNCLHAREEPSTLQYVNGPENIGVQCSFGIMVGDVNQWLSGQMKNILDIKLCDNVKYFFKIAHININHGNFFFKLLSKKIGNGTLRLKRCHNMNILLHERLNKVRPDKSRSSRHQNISTAHFHTLHGGAPEFHNLFRSSTSLYVSMQNQNPSWRYSES